MINKELPKKIIHFEYYSGIINAQDISTIESMLSKSNIVLDSFDKTKSIQASASSEFHFILNSEITKEILIGIVTNILWSSISNAVYFGWGKLRDWKSKNLNPKTEEKYKINFGITMTVYEHKQFEFKMDGELSEEQTLKSLDKILDFLKEVKHNPEKEYPETLVYNEQKALWEIHAYS